jgi:hypothetical protein
VPSLAPTPVTSAYQGPATLTDDAFLGKHILTFPYLYALSTCIWLHWELRLQRGRRKRY